ncbi:hypothetical protein AADG42_03350 [Ammonicoccus fulvus]|uniref:WXG100 family type VII secretion target n=1 Tax=Ammonicoccus fulvus TaxID=3138240 RepID=A0ABZ3FK26_9ACTN
MNRVERPERYAGPAGVAPDFRRAMRQMEMLRQEVHSDLGRQVQSWDFDAVTASSMQAYEQLLRTWQDSLQAMAGIIRALDEDQHRP